MTQIGAARTRYCSLDKMARKPPEPARIRPNTVGRQPRPRYTTPAATSIRPTRAAGSLNGPANTSKKAASAIISQQAAATSSWAHSLIRSPTARLAMATEASAHHTAPTAIRFSVPDRPKTGVSTRPISSGTSSDDG